MTVLPFRNPWRLAEKCACLTRLGPNGVETQPCFAHSLRSFLPTKQKAPHFIHARMGGGGVACGFKPAAGESMTTTSERAWVSCSGCLEILNQTGAA